MKLCFSFWQLGPNVKELFRLVEDFVDVISLRMKDFQDTYEVTDNLGQFPLTFSKVHTSAIKSECDGHVRKGLNVWTGSLEVQGQGSRFKVSLFVT